MKENILWPVQCVSVCCSISWHDIALYWMVARVWLGADWWNRINSTSKANVLARYVDHSSGTSTHRGKSRCVLHGGPLGLFLLGDEMGVGKTLQGVMMMATNRHQPGMNLGAPPYEHPFVTSLMTDITLSPRDIFLLPKRCIPSIEQVAAAVYYESVHARNKYQFV